MLLTRSVRRSRISAAFLLALVVAIGVTLSAQQQQAVPSTNINMVSGTTFPDGDPYLQRQNEPNAAVSTRNPLHLLAGANDYRTVDLPGPFDPMRGMKMSADAWVGLFKSTDGGQNWKSTLLPGFPQDESDEGKLSPIKGREGSTDPVMRSGTNGLFYYAGVAFDRGANKPSAIFVARYIDLNNVEAGDPFGYVDTRVVDNDSGTRFLDKVAVATDIPRTSATCTITGTQPNGTDKPTPFTQTIPAGIVYVAYAAFTGTGANEQSVVLISRSTNCGATYSTPIALSTGSRLIQNPQIAVSPVDGAVYVSWRRFKYSTQDDAIMFVKSIDRGVTWSKPVRIAGVHAFDQGTSATSFRTNGFQTMAIDATGRVYLAWADRGYAPSRPDVDTGDSRIVYSTSPTGATWTVPRAIQPEGIGHQLMPMMTFHGNKLRILYYDLREDVSGLFGPFIDELPILSGPTPRIRHTMDVFVAQAAPGAVPAFTTARVSDYASGFLPGSTVETRLQFNPPNLPLFRQGAVPFMGDYIDLAPAPPFVLNENGTWSFNTGASGSVVSHAVWTDNRDVRPPADGNWANYTPVTSPALGPISRFDQQTPIPACDPGQVGMRNQNIYTARVTDGLFVSVPGNNKQFNGFQRTFVVVAENASGGPRIYRLRIENQPPGGQASFLQFGAMTTIDIPIPALSSVARSVFVTSSDANARIRISVTEVGPGGAVVPNGLTGSVVLNPDPSNPSLQNPHLQNPNLQNPLISQAEAYNPGISTALVGVPNLQNPHLQNPNLQNPNLQNPSIQNPHLQNPNLQNPSLQNPVLQNDAVANPSIVNADLPNPSLQNPTLQNPNLQNPSLQNPNLQNAGISDTNWTVTNEGNTTASYTVNLLLTNPVPAGFSTQLLLHKTVLTPAADGCDLKQQAHTVLIANIPNPQFVTDPTNPNLQNPHLQNPSLQNPTLALAPGESATVTFRVVDPNIFDGVVYDASAAVTPAAVAQSVNTEDVAAGRTAPHVAIPLTIATSEIPPTTPGAPINRTLQMVLPRGTVTCSVVPGLGELPAGVTLSSSGTLSGTPTVTGNYVFTVECVDSGPPVRSDRQTLSIQVNPASPIGYDYLWNGLDSNWYNPANWSPRGVPTATSRVYLSAATTTTPQLTADVTVRDLFLEPGAKLDTNGFTLTVTNNIDAGRTIIGAGRTILTGNGSTAAGVYNNLEIRGRISLTAALTTTGTLTLGPGARVDLNGQSLIAGGQLITDVASGALPTIAGASDSLLIVAGANVNGLALVGAPLTIEGGTLTRFDNVSFNGFAPEAIQLTVNHPGVATHVAMNGLTFSTQPTSGQYIRANDTSATAPLLILDVFGAVPSDGSAFTLTGGGAAVNWLGNVGEANLAVTQAVSPAPAVVGTRLTYAITVTNGGPSAAQNVVLTRGIPGTATGITVNVSQGTCTLAPGGVSCAVGTIPSGASVSATVSFITSAAGTLTTTAIVTSTTADRVSANNSHTLSVPILPAGQGVDLRLTKTDSVDPVVVNQPFTYTLTLSNAGSTEATNVVVTDNVPSGISVTYATSASGMCSAVGAQVLCSFASLLPGQTVTMTLSATGTTVGAHSNQASVTSAQVELTPADNVATESTMVIATPNCGASFSGPVIFAATGATGDVLSGDLNGDGFRDIVAPVSGANAVAVLLGNGNGGFGTPTLYPSGLGTHEGILLDLNADGRLDLALEGLSDAFVLFGNGSGGFGAPTTISYGSSAVGDVRAGDFNGDGRPDLAIVTGTPNELHIRLNNGNGGFVESTAIALPATSDRIVVQDFNADGRPDLALSYFTSSGPNANLVSVLLGNGSGGFSVPATIPLQAGAQSRVFGIGDINGDTRTDLAVIEILTTGRNVYVLLGNGSGGFTSQLVTSAVTGAFRVEVGDVNSDGRRDLAVSNGSLLNVFLGDGTGGFGPPTPFSLPFGLQFELADFNRDGRLDVASALNQGNGVAILLNGCAQTAGDLVLAASDSPDPVSEGQPLTYSATVTNAGTAAVTSVTLTQTLSSLGTAGTPAPSQGTCTVTGRLMTCSLGALAPGASAIVQITFTPTGGGTLTSVIGVGSERPDSAPANNVATLTTTVTATGRQLVVSNSNDSGPGSLRQAIADSNADAGDLDSIAFNIPGAGVHTIVPLTALPAISQPVVIDGTTQPGFTGTPLIELNGNGLAGAGLIVTSGGSLVRGLVINRFAGTGIVLQTNGGNTVEGNFIGTDVSGTAARPNGNGGVLVQSANNLIGGSSAQAGNVISGNTGSGVAINGIGATNNRVQGNRIGTDDLATTSIANTLYGVTINGAASNTVGGIEAAHRNVISGNLLSGVSILGGATGNLVANNVIGTNGSGMSSIANGVNGVLVNGSPGNTVGTPDAGNVISGNALHGIEIVGTTSSANEIYANRIGTNFLGTAAVGNLSDGIHIAGAPSTVIGGSGLARNTIGGNGQHGIGIFTSSTGVAAAGTQIIGNTIGFRSPPNTVGNGLNGIHLAAATNTVVGGATQDATNTIAWNGRNGVAVVVGIGNRVLGTNSITDNAILGIDLGNNGVTANDPGDVDDGPNNLQNFPVLSGVQGGVQGFLSSEGNAGFVIRYFANTACDASGNGEGQTFLGQVSVVSPATGGVSLPLFAAPAGTIVTATATDSINNTSEFSSCVTVPSAAAAADMSLDMTESADPVSVGTPLTYTLTAYNAGPNQATNVVVVNTLPGGVSLTSSTASQGSCGVQGSTVTCNLGTIAVDASATITLTVTPSAPGTLHNNAFVTATQTDPVNENNAASAETTVTLASCTAVTFTGPTPFAGSPGPTGVVRLVDMNHDGYLDAVGTHETNPGGVDVWLNDGAGHFAAPRFTSAPSPWVHVVADFNGDTHPDVITATENNTPVHSISLRLLTNDGTGTLTLVPGFSLPFEGTLTAVDIDRDGDQDLVLIIGNDLILRRNDGQANFGAAETIIAGMAGWPAFGDFNGDNRTDVAVGIGTPGVAVALANASGGFLAPVVYAVAGGAHGLADPVDLNGDGRLDLFTIAGDDNEPAPGASVLFGDGAGSFGGAVQATPDFVYLPTLADVNGDGRPDLVGISSLSSFGVWLGNGGGTFAAPVQFANAVYYGPAVGDLNGDGRPDLATGDINGTLNAFFNNCGAAPANLRVAVAESADPVNEGGELAYTVTVTNLTGTAATGVRLTSVLTQSLADDPEVPNVTVLGATSSAGGTLATTGTTFVWTVPTLAANGAATFTFRFRPLAGDTLDFTAGVTSDGAETDPSDNGARETTVVNATGSTLTVTTTADSGPGSLRQAIEISNADSGDRDTIAFNIPGGGVPTITLQSGLDPIDQPVIIDGTTQPGSGRVELNGNNLQATGLVIQGGNAIVRGLVINRFTFDGISLEGNGGNVVEGNFIGTDSTGALARPNGSGGIRVSSPGNRIGGLTVAARNVISGNSVVGVGIQSVAATGNVVQGNYIGLNAAGTAALPNSAFSGAIQIFNGASNNTIGGAVSSAGNVISGNTFGAIGVTSANDNVIQGNFIGTDPSGAVRIANGGVGIDISGALRTVIGGTGLARNVVSGNTTGIQLRNATSGTRVENNYIGVNAAGTAASSNGTGVLLNTNAAGNTVGGTAAGTGNVISGNTGYGVDVQAQNNSIQGNLIGTAASGTSAVANGLSGVRIQATGSGLAIGGAAAGARNVISGNTSFGVRLESGTNITVRGNYIGTDITGSVAVANGQRGVEILGGTGATISENRIAFNGSDGVRVGAGTGHSILANATFSNAGLGIDIGGPGVTANDAGDADAGANNLQNFPVLSAAAGGVNGTLNSTANTTFTVEYFSNAACDSSGNGEGQTFLGRVSVATNASGNATLPFFSTAGGGVVTATATNATTNDTSEFSACVTPLSGPTTFTVSNTNDSGAGSLRQAILDANARVNTRDTIAFNIAGTGPHSILLQTPLPIISDSLIVDGTTEPDYVAGAPVVELNGSQLADAYGLHITANNSTVKGLVINGFGQPAASTNGVGIVLENSTGHVIQGNFIGTDVTGLIARPNRFDGIRLVDADTSTIGGTSADQRNVVSGNGSSGINLTSGSSNNVISGNYVGLNKLGTGVLGNGSHGINIAFNANSNGIGGGLPSARNVVSGNAGDGIHIVAGSSNQVIGNYFGTDVTGAVDLGNGSFGVYVETASNTLIGDLDSGGNLISGNNGGVQVQGGSGVQVLNNSIGLNAAGTGPLGNTTQGIVVTGSASSTLVRLNRIGANGGNGIQISASATGTSVRRNTIGMPNGSATALANTGNGILITGASSNAIGSATDSAEANVIWGNGASGIAVVAPATGNAIRRNSLLGNALRGIDLANNGVTPNDAGDGDSGANNLQNFPVLAGVQNGIQGTLNSRPNLVYQIDYFSNTACDPSGNGEGESHIGVASVTTDADGNVALPFFPLGAGVIVTATATAPTGDTSEFSSCVTVPSAPPSADLSLVMTDSSDPVQFGETYNYTMVARNNGPSSATNVVVTNTIPAGLNLRSASVTIGNCDIVNRTVTCTIGTLANNAQATVIVTVDAATTGLVANTASVSSSVADPVPGNNSDSEDTNLQLASCSTISFAGPNSYAVPGIDGFWVKHGDLNGDHAADLVTSMAAGRAVVVQLNDGNGAFGDPRLVVEGDLSWGFVLEDLNNDGRLDLAIMTGEGPTAALTVRMGDGLGAFGSPTSVPLGQSDPADLSAADLDNDGDIDLVAGGFNDNVLQVFRNDGQGGFAVRQTLTTTADSPGTPVIARINGDAFADIVVGDIEDGHVRIFLNNGSGGFQPETTLNTTGRTVIWAATDLTGDAIVDLLTQEGEPGATVTYLRRGLAGGGFASPVDLSLGATAAAVTVGDVNSDGRADLAVRHPSRGTVAVSLGNGNGTFGTAVHFNLPQFIDPNGELEELDDEFGWPFRPVVVADLNFDGRPDIAAGDGVEAVQVLLNICNGPRSDLRVTIGESADPVAEGAPLTYTVTVANLGPASVAGATVTATLPWLVDGDDFESVARLISASGSGGSCTVRDSIATCPVPQLAAGATTTFTFGVATSFGTSVTFTAGVSSGFADPNPGDNTATETTTVLATGRDLVVTNENDSGPGSLRAALELSNADSTDVDRITFNIPGAGVHTITLLSELSLSEPVNIDGRTQPGFAGAPLVALANGGGVVFTGLNLQSGSAVRALAVGGFQLGFSLNGNGNTLEGNYIGVAADGVSNNGNQNGVEVFGSNNLVGGVTAAARNVISGNIGAGVRIAGPSNLVVGNFIGTNAAGTAALGNGTSGVYIGFPIGAGGSGSNRIGGTTAGERNILSGNTGYGVILDSGIGDGNVVQGNYIGTNASGTAGIGNTLGGIRVSGNNSSIGGAVSGAGNLVSGNAGATAVGIEIQGASGTSILGNVIGQNAAGTASLANGFGISVNGSNNTIGGTAALAPNLITGSTVVGVRISGGAGNAVLNNRISNNAGLGIDLGATGVTPNDVGDGDTGANTLQNFPVLTAITGGVQGTLNSTANTSFTIQFFGNTACDPSGNGEGQTFLGAVQVTTDASGNATIPVFSAATGQAVTATATSSANNTSEFSACVTPLAGVQNFTVTNTNNSGAGSLRQAILDANASAGSFDTIGFNIPGGGPFSIALTAELPQLTDRVTIDGTTQPGYGGTPLIELNGTSAGGNANGLWLIASGSVIRGLAINRFGTGGAANSGGGAGIVIQGANAIIEANFIGTDPAGTVARPNRADGLWIDAAGARIGGTTAAVRNVISANGRLGILLITTASNTTIQGNYVGTSANGTADLGNTNDGIQLQSSGNLVGGEIANAGNVVSGNGGSGIWLNGAAASNNVVAGNIVGLNRTGTAIIANNVDGINITNATDNRVGGTSAAARNVSSGNGRIGVLIDGAASTRNVVQGNYIGTDVTGTLDLGNGFDGVNIGRGTNNTIGGSVSTGAGNVISGNNRAGVLIEVATATGNVVRGNFIGTTANGASQIGNGFDGVFLSAPNNIIGGSGSGEGNLIAGNGRAGINLDTGSNSTLIRGNTIGSQSVAFGNGTGILVASSQNVIGGSGAGEANWIAFSANAGISITAGTGNRILSNQIASNNALGIDLGGDGVTANDSGDADSGPNGRQNYPVLTAVSRGVEGTLASAANTTYTIQYYGNQTCDPTGFGEGQLFLGEQTVITNASGNATLPFIAVGGGLFVTATATSPGNDTSEFSACVQPIASQRFWTQDAGGAWENPANWSGGQVPQAGEDVIITTTSTPFTVTISSASVTLSSLFSTAHVAMSGGAITVNSSAGFFDGLTMSGGSLDGVGSIILYEGGASSWTGGTIGGPGALLNAGTFSITMPGSTLQLGRTFLNLGLMHWNTAGLVLNGVMLENFAGGVLDIQSNLTVTSVAPGGGQLFNLGILSKSGPVGAITINGTDATFYTSGELQLRLGNTSDSIVSTVPVTLAGALNLVLQPGFAPAEGATFQVMQWPSRTGSFQQVFGDGRLYDAAYGSNSLTVTAHIPQAVPIGAGAFTGGTTFETFAQNFGQVTPPVTFHGLTYSSADPQLTSNAFWDDYFENVAGASGGFALNDQLGMTNLQIDFSTPLKRVGLLASSAARTTFILKAYDDNLNLIGVTTATMTDVANGVFLGLQAPVNIRRIVITEPFDNGQFSIIDDIRYQNP